METFSGFTDKDFETFTIDGLDERMAVIQERIQPKFHKIGEALVGELSEDLDQEMYVHVARHARRTVNPPKDTWMAFCHNKRGYKKHPHFQVGLFDDHLFIWLAFIYELPNKVTIAKRLMEDKESISQHIPKDFVISLDHMKKDNQTIEEIDLDKALQRFHDVKKAEFLIGRHLPKGSQLLQDGEQLLSYVKETFQVLAPLYRISMK